MIILNYHELTGGTPNNLWALDHQLFHEHLAVYSADLIAPATFLEECGRAETARDRRVLLTFDDGFESDYSKGFAELIHESDVAFISFVPVNAVGRSGHLTWRMIDEMSRHGIAIGSHSMSHPDLTKLPADEARQELVASKQIIEDHVGKEANLFAFPFGKYNLRVCDMALEAGYTHLFTIQLGFHNGFEPFLYSRLCVTNAMSAAYIAAYISNPKRFRGVGQRLSARLGLYRPLMRWRMR